ncbi:MAG TPA: URC4/urg3 family protein [Leptolyngbyaceae cyanobacterium]
MNSKNIQHSAFSIQHSEIAYLLSAGAIRDRCGVLFKLGCEDRLSHFRCDLTQLERVADYVIEVMREEYPNLEIPFHSRWRHFEAGGVPRLAELDEMLAGVSAVEKTRVKFDLAIISVLLDAGAGNSWQYYEQESDRAFGRSEGLAVASFRLFCHGYLSTNEEWLLQADAQGLQGITEASLSSSFQVSSDNPLIGLAGRVELLQKLGKTLLSKPHIFGNHNPRPGNLVNYLLEQSDNGQLSAQTVLSAVLQGLGDIWPGRVEIAGANLGDVWHHPALQKFKTEDAASIHNSSFIIHPSLVPFHKLSQWLTYSLLEPLQELGLKITELNALTGLPEYRNGGLCIDLRLLQAKHSDIFQHPHLPDSEVIVEWRALTVILLDRVAETVRQKLNMNTEQLPLVKILQGGTWSAGRKIANELRAGLPPIQLESDGTVF